jgi:hypothetical protein
MPSVTIKSIMLSVVMLNVIMLNVMLPFRLSNFHSFQLKGKLLDKF